MSDTNDPAKIWDERYGGNESVYGEAPNEFFREYIDQQKTGQLLLPCEGEGRNAIYAAKHGWKVDAFDFSTVAIQKALLLAKKQKVVIQYEQKKVENFSNIKTYDLIALVYVHLLPELRTLFHRQLANSLNENGTIIIEAFSKNQLQYHSGGPKDISMLYSSGDLLNDFKRLNIKLLEEQNIHLSEGSLHRGEGAVIRMVASR